MIDREAIESAVRRVVQAAHAPTSVCLFGSYARGDADTGPDIDLLIVERDVQDPAEEHLKLHRAASGHGIGVDILLMTESEFEKKRDWWTTPVYAAVREGKLLYERK
jgi:predicted nucleotidyltransferase